MRVGLGTGSTAEHFLELLAGRIRDSGLRNIVATPTSRRTEERARSFRIPLADLNDLRELDLVVDGADEVDANLDLIKGGGGALLREKIVAASARRMIVIADESKYVSALGAFPLPVEVVPFGHATTEARICRAAKSLGYAGFAPRLRRDKSSNEYRTDNGNVIYDCPFGAIANAAVLSERLSQIPGVVEHGLFVGMASVLILGGRDGLRLIERMRR